MCVGCGWIEAGDEMYTPTPTRRIHTRKHTRVGQVGVRCRGPHHQGRQGRRHPDGAEQAGRLHAVRTGTCVRRVVLNGVVECCSHWTTSHHHLQTSTHPFLPPPTTHTHSIPIQNMHPPTPFSPPPTHTHTIHTQHPGPPPPVRRGGRPRQVSALRRGGRQVCVYMMIIMYACGT